jgi:hypothetical protein
MRLQLIIEKGTSMKYKLVEQHYDMLPNTIWFDAGPAVPSLWVGESRVVTAIDGDGSETAMRIVPVNKLEKIDA